MFTGIIKNTATILEIEKDGTNLRFRMESDIVEELNVDQSVCHDGVCLTVTQISNGSYWVDLVDETLKKSKFSTALVGDIVNLERSLSTADLLDGHLVQGHVDTVGEVLNISPMEGSWIIEFSYPPDYRNHLVSKGSICINGVSLTVVDVRDESFTVTIIPYTFENTNLHQLTVGDFVNLEFDILGKYVLRYLSTIELK